MLIWDTVTSFIWTPFRSDFIDFVKADINVKYVTKVNQVIGIGTTIKTFVYTNGTTCYFPCVSYHITSTDVRLFSLQTYHQTHGGYYSVHVNQVMINLKDHEIKITTNSKNSNITVITDYFVIIKEKEKYVPQFKSALDHSDLSKLYYLDILEPKGFAIIRPLRRELMQRILNLNITISFVAFVLVHTRRITCMDHKRI